MTTSAPARFRELVASKLSGRKLDLVGFVDSLLELVREAGEVHCGLAAENCLRVAVGGQTCEVELPAARAKLRMVCARLSVLCNEANKQVDFPYGGEGTIAASDSSTDRWKLVFKNTPGEHEFGITLCRPPHCPAPRPDIDDQPGGKDGTPGGALADHASGHPGR